MEQPQPTVPASATADEGIWMAASAPASASSLQTPELPQPPPPCCSISDGYSTSRDSLTSSSTDTISVASDSSAPEPDGPSSTEDAGDEAVFKLDSLTLALHELSDQNDEEPQQTQTQTQLPRPLVLTGAGSARRQGGPQRRCSSMKSHKTPPDTPNQMKKAVRFADAFGLDLAYVKHVFDTEKPPVVPPQAMRDLHLPAAGDSAAAVAAVGSMNSDPQHQRRLFISPCFAQPGSCANFASRVATQKVVLERAGASPHPRSNEISGLVRVSNVGFEKSVLARLTLDGWRSTQDVPAEYVANSCNGATDQFEFVIRLPGHFGIGDRAVFCVQYVVGGEVYWDNNFGDNYAFDCFAVNCGRGGGGGVGGSDAGAFGYASFL